MTFRTPQANHIYSADSFFCFVVLCFVCWLVKLACLLCLCVRVFTGFLTGLLAFVCVCVCFKATRSYRHVEKEVTT